jgi:acetone carboxylase gamma subunit
LRNRRLTERKRSNMSDNIQKTVQPKAVLKDLIEGKLSPEEIREIQRRPKDENVFSKILEIEQERVSWPEPILAPLQEHLYIVQKGRERIVKCSCGHEFGDYRKNWKLNALVYERNPEDGEVYVGPRAFDSQWVTMREFYCPGCGTQLEVELLPHGYPFVFDAELDVDGFYDRNPELKNKIITKSE